MKEGPAPLSASLVQRENTGFGYVYPESAEHAAPDCTGKDGDSVVTHFVWASWSLRHVRKTCADIHSVSEEHFAGPLWCGCPRQCVAKVSQPCGKTSCKRHSSEGLCCFTYFPKTPFRVNSRNGGKWPLQVWTRQSFFLKSQEFFLPVYRTEEGLMRAI